MEDSSGLACSLGDDNPGVWGNLMGKGEALGLVAAHTIVCGRSANLVSVSWTIRTSSIRNEAWLPSRSCPRQRALTGLNQEHEDHLGWSDVQDSYWAVARLENLQVVCRSQQFASLGH